MNTVENRGKFIPFLFSSEENTTRNKWAKIQRFRLGRIYFDALPWIRDDVLKYTKFIYMTLLKTKLKHLHKNWLYFQCIPFPFCEYLFSVTFMNIKYFFSANKSYTVKIVMRELN